MITLPATYLDKNGPKPLTAMGIGRLQSLLKPLGTRVVVLGRTATYFVEEDVALHQARDIRAYLRSNASVLCPFPSWQALFMASERKNSNLEAQPRTRLAIWFYDPAMVEALVGQKAVLVIPEDLAIARQTESRALYMVGNSDQQRYLLYASRGQLLNTEFLAAGEGGDTQADIRELAGVAPQALAGNDREQAIQRGLRALGVKDLAGLLKFPARGSALSPAAVRPLLMTVAVLAVVWLAGSSAVIRYQNDQMQQAMDGLSGDLKTVLAANRTEQKLRERLEFLLPLVNEYPHASNVFRALSTLGMENITVNRIGLTGEQLQITGEANSASALLAEVSSMPWVSDARFSSPVSRRNGVDRFTLVVDIKREALIDDVSA